MNITTSNKAEPPGRESRLVGTVRLGENRSEWVGKAVGMALKHMFGSGHDTVYLRVDSEGDGPYRITYSPDLSDISDD